MKKTKMTDPLQKEKGLNTTTPRLLTSHTKTNRGKGMDQDQMKRHIELVTVGVLARHGSREQINGYIELTQRWNRG